MVRLLRLHHAQITVPRGAEDRAREFYCEVMGLDEIPKAEALRGRGGFWLRLDGQEIHVGTEEGADRAATKAHLAYEVADLEAWRARLSELGFQLEDGVPIPGFRRFEFPRPVRQPLRADPAGGGEIEMSGELPLLALTLGDPAGIGGRHRPLAAGYPLPAGTQGGVR